MLYNVTPETQHGQKMLYNVTTTVKFQLIRHPLCYSLQLKSNIKSAIPSQAKWSRIFGHELSWINI